MTTPTSDKIYNILILCTGNSARSIIGEALINKEGKGRFRGFSAGSTPKGQVNPHALDVVRSLGFDPSEFRSKSWDEFAQPDSPPLDFVITVCDNAAGEVCPVWPGQPMTAHWGIPDPAAVQGSPAEEAAAFSEAARQLGTRIRLFMQLPLASIDAMSLRTKMRQIHETADQPQRAG